MSRGAGSQQTRRWREPGVPSQERRGETYQDEAEGRRATQKSYRWATAKSTDSRPNSHSKTRAERYAEARRRDIPNRSKMNRAELEQALHHD
jgi:hypothetical protein